MASKGLKRGIFITFEGPEGCGKSTHCRLLYDYLRKRSYTCVMTREPGGTALGEAVRQVLLHSRGLDISDFAELFLFEAARAQIVKEVVAPALEKKRIVICDRFSDATIAYQGYGGGLPLKAIRAVDDEATRGIRPDLTILLDIDTKTGLKRAGKKGKDRMEEKAVAYHGRVRRGYLELAKEYPERIRVLRSTGPINKVQRLVRCEVEIVIQRCKRAG